MKGLVKTVLILATLGRSALQFSLISNEGYTVNVAVRLRKSY